MDIKELAENHTNAGIVLGLGVALEAVKTVHDVGEHVTLQDVINLLEELVEKG